MVLNPCQQASLPCASGKNPAAALRSALQPCVRLILFQLERQVYLFAAFNCICFQTPLYCNHFSSAKQWDLEISRPELFFTPTIGFFIRPILILNPIKEWPSKMVTARALEEVNENKLIHCQLAKEREWEIKMENAQDEKSKCLLFYLKIYSL